MEMSDGFMGEIRIMSFSFPPKGWALCNGQLLPINQNQALFSLLGTRYGGDGRVNFALPDLRGRIPLHWGGSYQAGDRAGEYSHTVTISELPQHTHFATAMSSDGTTPVPATNALAASGAVQVYGPAAALTSLHPGSLSNVGGSQPHQNMQPYLTLSFCIFLVGIFPSA
jgi:microcystin-dependent protein